MCIESALLKEKRLFQYKRFAVAFSYPEGEFFNFFPEQKDKGQKLPCEYDRLFRSAEVWLYGSEYKIKNEFQRAQDLADINGFYRAFGLQTDKERPDSLPCELEFMHYLIFKEMRAPDKEKFSLCLQAQREFFHTHLYPAAGEIAKKVMAQTQGRFYRQLSEELLAFIEEEREVFNQVR